MHFVLLVEDEPMMQDLYLQSLRASSFKADVAVNGVDGLQKIRTHKPDLVLSDLMMPEMDGFQLLKKMKEDRALKDIPVVVLTNLTEDRHVSHALELGATRVIYKSDYEPRQIMQIVGEVLATTH